MRNLGKIAPVLLVLVFAGCQCCSWSEPYGDFIDDVSDHHFCMDRFYRPECDLTRIGKPEWCQSRWNRFWCRLACGKNCSACAGDYCESGDCPTGECTDSEVWISGSDRPISVMPDLSEQD